jgi:hypothetical protein
MELIGVLNLLSTMGGEEADWRLLKLWWRSDYRIVQISICTTEKMKSTQSFGERINGLNTYFFELQIEPFFRSNQQGSNSSWLMSTRRELFSSCRVCTIIQ